MSFPHRMKRAILGACAMRAPQLAALLRTPVPIPVLRYETSGGHRGKRLLVLLPGIGDTAACYERQGFVAAARQRELATDVWAVDAHVGYYAGRTILERLEQDVIRPAQDAGYRSITLAGISLGAFGALLYASRDPASITRVIALAPFLGRPAVVREVAAGGLAAWQDTGIATHDYERRLWAWLKGYATDPSSELPSLYLGFGERDPFAPAHRVLSAVLPSQQVVVAEGGHTWRTWRQLWSELHGVRVG